MSNVEESMDNISKLKGFDVIPAPVWQVGPLSTQEDLHQQNISILSGFAQTPAQTLGTVNDLPIDLLTGSTLPEHFVFREDALRNPLGDVLSGGFDDALIAERAASEGAAVSV